MAEFDPDAFLAKDKEKKRGFDPDAFLKKTQPETALQTFGRSAASMADSALNAVTGTLDYGAYALARAAGLSPEQATAETTSPKDVVGRAFGVTGTPGYEQAPLRQLGTAIGTGLQENVIAPVAQTTGLPEADVANMVNTGMIAAGPAVPKVAKGAVNTGKALVQTPIDVAKGAVGRASGYIAEPGVTPKGYQVPSSRMPLGETYYPAEGLAQLKQNPTMLPSDLPPALGEQPIKNLAPGPVIALSGGEVPMAGKTAQAFGERIGETYRNPITAAIDIGSFGLTGVPWYTTAKGSLAAAQGVADWMLGRKGFEALSNEQRAALAKGQNPWATGPVNPSDIPAPIRAEAAAHITPVQPQLGYSPEPTPTTIPMGGPGRRVNIEGESFNLPYEIDTSSVQPTGPRQATPQPTLGPVAPETIAPTPAPAVSPTTNLGIETGQKLSVEEILNRVKNKQTDVFETAGKKTTTPPKSIEEVRTGFADQLDQQIKNMEETRAQNKETYAEQGKALRDATGRDEALIPRDETITRSAALKKMLKNTANGGIRSYKNETIVNRALFDEIAADAGVALDWTTAPKPTDVVTTRKDMINWVHDTIKREVPELGLGERSGGMRAQIKHMEEANKDIPTDVSADAIKAAQERQNKLRKTGGRDTMEMMSKPDGGDTIDIGGFKGVYTSKQAYDAAKMLDQLGQNKSSNIYMNDAGNKLIQEIDRGPLLSKKLRATDLEGNPVPLGEKWTVDDPKWETTRSKVEKKLNKKKGK